MVDDHIPIKPDGEAAFAIATDNSCESTKLLWVTILEKAWAKVHKSYDRIQMGAAGLTFRDLTGAPSWEHDFDDKDTFRKLLEGTNKEYVMAASVSKQDVKKRTMMNAKGLRDGHNYSLL